MSKRYYHENPGTGIMGWVLALGGGYIVLNMLGINPISLIESILGIAPTSNVPVTTGTTTNANNPPITTTPSTTVQTTTPAPTGVGTPNTKQLVQTAMANDGMPALNSVDVYNYYYAAIRGVPGPPPETLFPSNDRNMKYSIDEWWTAMSGQGFSGLGVFGGLGAIANMSPYTAGVGGPTAGRGYSPLGSETFIKWLS